MTLLAPAILRMFIEGDPAPQPRPRARAWAVGGKHIARIYKSDSDESAAWKKIVGLHARVRFGEYALAGPLCVVLVFTLTRPDSHYGTGRNAGVLKADAPEFPESRPDLDNLEKAVLDALTDSRIWKDDSRIVALPAVKLYGPRPGVEIAIRPMEQIVVQKIRELMGPLDAAPEVSR